MLDRYNARKLLAAGLIAGILPTFGCAVGDDVATSDPTPTWVVELIDGLEAEPIRNPPASIASYSYRGDTVYYVPPYCCDTTSVLYDTNGDVICYPDGGITGGGDGRCTDFFDVRRGESVVWEDLRIGGD